MLSRVSEIARPDDLPDEWSQMLTATGRVFYVNHRTKTTQWNDPRHSAYYDPRISRRSSLFGSKSDIIVGAQLHLYSHYLESI